MSKRKWTNIKKYEAEIIAMRAEGKKRQEIAEYLGLEKGQIKIGSDAIIRSRHG